MVNKVSAPFTDEQVAGINAYQHCPDFHPFTCPMIHHNNYIQFWVHPLMVDWGWKIFDGGWATDFGRKKDGN